MSSRLVFFLLFFESSTSAVYRYVVSVDFLILEFGQNGIWEKLFGLEKVVGFGKQK